MADVLFTHSYFLRFDPKEHTAMMPYPPLGTLYAAAHVRNLGFSPALFDTMLAESEEELEPHLHTHAPRFVVIFDDDFNYLTKMCLTRMREAAFRMSRMAQRHGCTVIVHGSDAADHAADYMSNGADVVVFGEGEITLGEVLVALSSGHRDISGIQGIAYRSGDRIVRNGARDVLRTLDTLPFPARDLVDVEKYYTQWRQHHGYTSLNVVTTRGCPFHCNWCAKPLYGQVYHSRSPENVVEEFLLLKTKYRPDHIWICDDIFGLKPGWVEEFATLLQKQAAIIPFKCLSRADLLLKDDTIRHLARAGCQSVWIGAESGSQKVLDAMEKGTRVEQIYEASRRLREAGLRIGFFLQYGYPGETRSDIDLTLKMVRDCRPDEIGISVSYPLPGTPFYQRVLEQMGAKRNWVDSQDLDLMFQGTFAPDFYRVLHRITHKKFRIWEGRHIVSRLFGHPQIPSSYDVRRVASVAFHMFTLPPLLLRLRRLERNVSSIPTTSH